MAVFKAYEEIAKPVDAVRTPRLRKRRFCKCLYVRT